MQTKKDTYSSRKFIVAVTITSLLCLLCIGLISFLVDPFFQFRAKPDTRYFLSPRLATGGLAKNYDYNTVVLGSSMTQNFNLNILRELYPDAKPVRLSTGGMDNLELEYVYQLIKKDKVNRFIINLDIPQFNVVFEEIRYPTYLYEDGILNKLKYLYSYETFVRFAPIDIGLTLYLKDKSYISPKYDMKTNIDNIGNNSLENEYGAEFVKNLYLSNRTVSPQHLENMQSRMEKRLDTLFAHLSPEKYPNAEFIFILPSYSALYWYHSRNSGYYTQFLNFTRHIYDRVAKYSNASIVFFFDIEEITDLNNYADITHFNPAVSDKILQNIANPEYKLNRANIDYKLNRLDSLVNKFAEQNKDWLK